MASGNYHFTFAWFEDQKYTIKQFIPPPDPAAPYEILEIGSFEGYGTVFFIDNFLEHPDSKITSIDPFDIYDPVTPVSGETKKQFLHNISQSKYPEKHLLLEDFSVAALPVLMERKQQYDLIMVDGSHLPRDVLTDAVMTFRLLKVEGYLFFDDYSVEGIKRAIDCFAECFGEQLRVIHSGRHFLVQRTS